MTTHPERRFDVVGIGNALVDVLVHTEDSFIDDQGLVKGSMTLIDADRAVELYRLMGSATEVSGGSAANTIAGVASLGGVGAYIGKVRDDQLGDIFAHDMRAIGVEYEVPRSSAGEPTGRCLILVSDDGERTLSTFLGASTGLSPDDIDGELVHQAKILYLEGYLWDPPLAKAAMREAASHLVGDDQRVALTLSDSFCVDRHRESFRDLIDDSVDVLFANEDEIMSLVQVDTVEEAIALMAGRCETLVVTLGSAGSTIVGQEGRVSVPAEHVAKLADTTGAGDLYASGFLVGLARGLDLETCGRMGSIAAAEVISHMGPRPEADLAALVAQSLDG
jgi:sugar/nucleoside kinase (ribokinase family)